VKTALDQALRLRGSRDFATPEEYLVFVRSIIARERNGKAESKLAIERQHLRPLPSCRVPDYTVHEPTVRRWSTIRIGKRAYSVPSQLIGYKVRVRQYSDVLEVYYKDRLVETLPRLRGDDTVRIDYRHVAWSLVRKPGAFARYRHREELFPTLRFRLAYDALKQWCGDRADIEYVRILHLAAATMESCVDSALQLLLEGGERFTYADVKGLADPDRPAVPEVQIPEPDLAAYDQLLGGVR